MSMSLTMFIFVLATTLLCTGQTTRTLVVQPTDAIFPTDRVLTAVHYDGADSIYVLGGTQLSGMTFFPEILKFSISNESIQVVANLTHDADGGFTIGDENGNINYFTIGRWINPDPIHRFNPVTGEVTFIKYHDAPYVVPIAKVNLTTFISYALSKLTAHDTEFNELYLIKDFRTDGGHPGDVHNAVWDGADMIYLFAMYPHWPSYPVLHSYNVTSDQIETTRLYNGYPIPTREASLVWRDGLIYIFGSDNDWPNSAVRINPATKEAALVPLEGLSLPDYHERAGVQAVYVKEMDRVYLFAGMMDRVNYIQFDK